MSIDINGDIEKIKALEDNILEQYNKNVELEKKMEQETEKFAEQANTAIEDYNSNAEVKTDNFNANAEAKTDDFDNNATEKKSEITDIAEGVKNMATAIQTEMANKKDGFDTNAEEKTNTFNSNVETKTTEFNNNSNTKTEEFNNNSTEKINAFNSNAEEKIADYNEHVETLTSRIADLEEETEDLFNALNTEKASGNELYIDDAKACRIMNTEIGGMYKQETREGYNLLDIKEHEATSAVKINSITDTTINFTTSSDYQYEQTIFFKNIALVEGKTYTISTEKENIDNNSGGGAFELYNGQTGEWIKIILNKTANRGTFSVNESKIYAIRLKLSNANQTGYTGQISNLIVYEGTKNKTYEPYTGGNPSPNPDYPQEIKQVESVKLNIRDKNLCDGINQNYYLNNDVNIMRKSNR